MIRRAAHKFGGLLIFAATLSVAFNIAAKEPRDLKALGEDYPRAYFFRACEGAARRQDITYREWDRCFSRLMGIEGKVLAEELPHMPRRNVEFFTRFKRDHPEQIVLLHYNGNACDPRFASAEFFAGHWLYYNGAKIRSDVPAEEGETEIEVDCPALFRTNIGRYCDSNEDIGLCAVGADGKPDWHQSEQVQLVAVDLKRKRIRVRRGCYGTGPRAFPAGSYAAAHVTEGPWGRKSNLMWFYNYATCCPRDRKGRVCSDVLAEDVAGHFSPGSELAGFDGIQFDVFKHNVGKGSRGRAPDCNADGRPDRGVIDGVNQYGIGSVAFCRKLRAKMGDDRLILADGMSSRHQRAFGILNGIESEGWPTLSDWQFDDWSGGLNRHFFWQQNARKPVFNYINHKYVERTDEAGGRRNPDVPFSVHRLVFAVAMFTDSAVCYSFAPPRQPGEMYGIWDELHKGTEDELGWLGRPLGPPMRMARQQPDLLQGQGAPISRGLLTSIGGDVKVTLDSGRMKVEGVGNAGPVEFFLRKIPCDGPDLFVSVTARAEPMAGYPDGVARLMSVGLAPTEGKPLPKGPARFMSWIGRRSFTSGFYFPNVDSKTVDLCWHIEGSEPVWIEEIRVHSRPDAICRLFEDGLVLANPSPRPYTFDLEAIAPARKFRRLKGSSRQDPKTNSGKPVKGKLTLGPKDALFLVEEN